MRLLSHAALWLTLAAPVVAQAQPAYSRSIAPTARITEWAGRSAAQPYAPSEPSVFEGGLPSNLTVPDRIVPLIEHMWQRSATFRRQCARLSSAPGLSVVISIGQAPAVSSARAQTQVVTKPNGRLEATVQIRPPDDVVELIAHEIEHVIEQLDGVDLWKREGSGDASVAFTDHHAFETRRAHETGLKVAREVKVSGK